MKRNTSSFAHGRFSKSNFVILLAVFIGIGCYTVLKSSAAAPLGSALPSLLPSSSGSQLFVSSTGSGTACSQASPCSMQTGINQSAAGTTIEALGGMYSVNIVWSNKSGTAASPITLENYQGQSVTLHAAASTSEMFKINNNSSFVRIKGLKIEATPTLWTGTGNQPFYISGATGAHDIDILDNDFSGYDAGTTTGHDITAFLAGPGATNINIVGNRCHNWGTGASQRQCFYIQADSGLVANNLVYDDPNGFGIQIRANTSAVKTCNMIVANNTVVNIKGQRGIYVEANCSGARVRNNVIAFSGAEELYGLFDSDDSVDPPASTNRAFTNLLWDTSGKIQGNTSGHQVLDFTDGSGDYTGPGSNTVGDPQFNDSASDDFQLKSTSPAIGQADPAYSLPYDFNGSARDSSPDLGALEYGSGSTNKLGDINQDGSVNIFDLSILLSNYSTTAANCDLNNDGVVNIFDLSILLSHYGT